MAKSSKTAVKNGKVRERARTTVADARRLAKELPKKHRKKLVAIAAELDDAAGGSDKKLARHPKRARRLEKSTERLEKRLVKTRRRHTETPATKDSAGSNGGTDAAASVSPTASPTASGVVGGETTAPTTEGSAADAGPAPQPGDAPAVDAPAVESAAVEQPAVGASTLAAAQAATLPTSDLHSLTVFELRRRAKESGHRGFWSLTKAQLIDLLS